MTRKCQWRGVRLKSLRAKARRHGGAAVHLRAECRDRQGAGGHSALNRSRFPSAPANGRRTLQAFTSISSIAMSNRLFAPCGVVLTVSLAGVASLSGCASPAEIAAAHRQNCSSFGFAPGTDAFANCMMQADVRRERADAQREKEAADWRRNQSRKGEADTMPATTKKENCQTTESVVSTAHASAPGGAVTQPRSSTSCSSF